MLLYLKYITTFLCYTHLDCHLYPKPQQLAMGWEGLAQEVINICQKAGLPNACPEFVNREKVKEAILYRHLKEVKEEYEMKT